MKYSGSELLTSVNTINTTEEKVPTADSLYRDAVMGRSDTVVTSRFVSHVTEHV